MLVKGLCMLALGSLGYKAVQTGAVQVGFLVDFATNTTTLAEVKGIAKNIYVDLVIGNYELPPHNDAWWSDYIKTNMHSDVAGRDTSKDLWQNPYRVRDVENVPGRGGRGFTVRSAGPDEQYHTDDDVVASYNY